MGAQNTPAIPTPTDLDGYTVDDVMAALDQIDFKRGRTLIGLLLWKLRQLEPSDKAYGERVTPIADRFDVTVATLNRWRQTAEDEYGLAPALDRPKTKPQVRSSRSRDLARPETPFPWAVPHSQDAAKLAHDDIVAKLGVGPAKSFLRDELARIGKAALPTTDVVTKPKAAVRSSGGFAGPAGASPDSPGLCPHPKTAREFNGTFATCGACGKINP